MMNLPDVIERLRDVLRRQRKALSTEASYDAESLSVQSPLESVLGGTRPSFQIFPVMTQAAAPAPRFPKSAFPQPA
ncbi:MAG: hypothetical protein P4L87_00890 [Formivibrio sp.]|nr:hypothetical protein [Formivibrio sp.]